MGWQQWELATRGQKKTGEVMKWWRNISKVTILSKIT
jgi:hypothetical protein